MHVEDIPTWIEQTPLSPSAFVCVLTRGHRQDYDAVRALAGRDLRFVGLIGSRAKVARLVDRALEEGLPADWLRRLHAPIDVFAHRPAIDVGERFSGEACRGESSGNDGDDVERKV